MDHHHRPLSPSSVEPFERKALRPSVTERPANPQQQPSSPRIPERPPVRPPPRHNAVDVEVDVGAEGGVEEEGVPQAVRPARRHPLRKRLAWRAAPRRTRGLTPPSPPPTAPNLRTHRPTGHSCRQGKPPSQTEGQVPLWRTIFFRGEGNDPLFGNALLGGRLPARQGIAPGFERKGRG